MATFPLFVKFVGLLLLFVLSGDSTQQAYDTESICLVVTFRKWPSRCSGVQPFGVSEPHWKKKSCLGLHIKYVNTNENWWAKKNVLTKFTIVPWAPFIATLGHMQLTGHVAQGLYTPIRASLLEILPYISSLIFEHHPWMKVMFKYELLELSPHHHLLSSDIFQCSLLHCLSFLLPLQGHGGPGDLVF